MERFQSETDEEQLGDLQRLGSAQDGRGQRRRSGWVGGFLVETSSVTEEHDFENGLQECLQAN